MYYLSQVYLYNTHYFSQASVLLGLLDPENESLMTLENTDNYLPSNTVSHPRGLESSAAWL